MEFNIQDYLRDMREEQQQDHKDLSAKVDEMATAFFGRVELVDRRVSRHETRLVVVENTRRSLRWLGAALIGAVLTLAGDIILEHLPHAAAAVINVGEHK